MKNKLKISAKIIYLKYSKDIFRYAFSILKNKEDAEDISQETFERFITSFDNYGGDCSLKIWLITVTRNLCYDKLKMKKTLSLENDFDYSSNTISSIENKITIESALEMLSPKDNEIIFLRDYLGYDYKTIANLLNISEDNAKIRSFRAKQKLKKIILE